MPDTHYWDDNDGGYPDHYPYDEMSPFADPWDELRDIDEEAYNRQLMMRDSHDL